jgi:hypothetical protein
MYCCMYIYKLPEVQYRGMDARRASGAAKRSTVLNLVLREFSRYFADPHSHVLSGNLKLDQLQLQYVTANCWTLEFLLCFIRWCMKL